MCIIVSSKLTINSLWFQAFGHSWEFDKPDSRPVYRITFDPNDPQSVASVQGQLDEIKATHDRYVYDDGPNSYFKTVLRPHVSKVEPGTRKVLEIEWLPVRVLKDPDNAPPGYTPDRFSPTSNPEKANSRYGNVDWRTRVEINGHLVSLSARRIPFIDKIFEKDPVMLKDERTVDHLNHYADDWDHRYHDFTPLQTNKARAGLTRETCRLWVGGLYRRCIRPGQDAFGLGYSLLDAFGIDVGDIL